MAFDEQVAERIRKGLAGHQTVEKRMFGGLCFMVKGAMCRVSARTTSSRALAASVTTRR